VVLELLSTIYGSQVSVDQHRLSVDERRCLVDNGQKQSKSEKIHEWKSLPLSTDSQRHAWWAKKQEGVVGRSQSSSGNPHTLEAFSNASPLPEAFDNVYSGRRMASSAQESRQPEALAHEKAADVVPGNANTLLEPTCQNLDDTAARRVSEANVDDSTSLSTQIAGVARSPALSSAAAERWRKYF
jgi:hypothetical protein